MKNIRKNSNKIFKVRLNYENYWDFQLAQDNIQCLNCEYVISGDVVATFDFNTVSGMCSQVIWDDAISFSGDVCDIGLTGYDNRFVENFTGETFNPSGNTEFCLYPVSGDTFCYSMNMEVDEEINVNYIQYCGGFHQGFYKLYGYDYEVLPQVFYNGWTKEFWLRKESCPSGDIVEVTGETVYMENGNQIQEIWSLEYLSGGTCTSGITLNDMYPNNKGIFYYWGTRAENKFCLFSPLSGLTTCTGIPLAPEAEIKEFEPENGFLYYNRKQVCKPTPNPTVEYSDCCDELINNAIAFRITDEGAIGLRLLTTTGECMSVEDTIKWVDSPIIEEYYSKDGLIEDDTWYHVTYRFEPYDTSECLTYRTGAGVLSIFIDGFLKLKIDTFPEIIPYRLDEHKDKQLAVPFNISIGGGTQGLLESYPEDLGDFFETSGYTACDYVSNLVEPCGFGGISINGEEIISPDLNINEPELIELWLEMVITNRVGNISVSASKFNRRNSLRIEINGVLDTLDYIILSNGGRLNLCNPKCYDVPAHDGKCGYLEEHFAGSFIGGIADYRLHDRPLCFSEIKCNYNQEKRKYNKHRDKPNCE